jgi:hypothetical protein
VDDHHPNVQARDDAVRLSEVHFSGGPGARAVQV